MKTNLSPLEELRAKRALLKEECRMYESNIKSNVSYVKQNLGSLLFSSFFTSTKNSLASMFSSSSGSGNSQRTSFISKVSALTPIIFSIAQPIIIGVITKKIKSMIFGKKK